MRQLVDAQGQVQLTKRYDPFGGLESVTGLAQSAYGFAGEEQDPDTDHLFLRARTYNPSTGRFLQQDSVLGTPNDPRTLHRYAYGFSNPVNYTDPSGLMPPINAAPVIGNQSTATRDAMYRHFIQNSQSYASPAPTQVSPQARYAAQVRRPGFNSTALGRPGGGIPRVQAARSVNGNDWRSQSDPLAREQSRERGIHACGLSDLLTGFVQAGLNGDLIPTLVDFAMHVPELARPLMMISSEDWLQAFRGQPGLLGGFQVLIGDPSGLSRLLEQVSWETVGEFFNGQIEDLKAMWQPGDWRMWASLGIGLSTTLIAAGVGAVLVGAAIPAVVAGGILLTVGAGAVLANTAFNAWIYNRWDTFGADLAGGGVEMAFGIAGGAIGGPAGWLIGAVIGAGLGQITSNVLSGEVWHRGLLGSMLISGVADGVGGAIGHAAGGKLKGGLDAEAPSRPRVRDEGSLGRELDTDAPVVKPNEAEPLSHLDPATADRLQNLDRFTGGNQPRAGKNEIRQRLTSGSDRQALSRRLEVRQRLRNVTADDPSLLHSRRYID